MVNGNIGPTRMEKEKNADKTLSQCTVNIPEKNLHLLDQGPGRMESFGNDAVSIVHARKYDTVRMT